MRNIYTKILISFIFASVLSACGGGGGGGSDDNGGSDDGSSGVNYGDLSGSCSLRITNGEQCTPTTGPITLLVLGDAAGNPYGVCTGALLTPNSILTAAHCLEDRPGTVAVRVGDERRFASSYVIHPKYNSQSQISPYDVAVVTLSQGISGTTIPLRVSSQVQPGSLINISGFGKDESGQSFGTGVPFDSALNKSEMIVDEVEQETGLFDAKYDSTKSSVCSGDSGGPAIQLNSAGNPGVVGVAQAVGSTSSNDSGEPTCLSGSIAVFTGISNSEVLSFIQSNAPNAAVN